MLEFRAQWFCLKGSQRCCRKFSRIWVEVLRQVALIDQVLDDAEAKVIQKFIKAYGFDYSVTEMREKVLQGEKADFVRLRQSVLKYLTLGDICDQKTIVFRPSDQAQGTTESIFRRVDSTAQDCTVSL